MRGVADSGGRRWPAVWLAVWLAACGGEGAAGGDAGAGGSPDAGGEDPGRDARTPDASARDDAGRDSAVRGDAAAGRDAALGRDAATDRDAEDAPDAARDASSPDARGSDAAVPRPDAAPVADARSTDAGARADAAPDATLPDAAAIPDADTPDVFIDPRPLPDLAILSERILTDFWLDERDFTAESCAVVEGCVVQPGRRRLLRFNVSAANVGDVDLRMGRPEENPGLFRYSACHDHFHFEDYAHYELQDADGRPVVPGRKQAFCLLDSARYLEDDPDVRRRPQFSCDFQGISRGWYDSYHSGLDCQWLDVTDIPPGEYRLQVRINPRHVLEEKRFDNNDAVVRVTLPALDLDAACGGGEVDGLRRSCGWALDQNLRCEPGDLVRVGCNGEGGCRPGDGCEGNPVLRVCTGEGAECLPGTALSQSDDACDTECPHTEFFCPEAGVVTVWKAASHAGDRFDCDLRVQQVDPPRPTDECALGEGVEGLSRLCGWDLLVDDQDCLPGFDYQVGCNPQGCGIGAACEGDPMIRVCEGGKPCLPHQALGQNDDDCGNTCPVAAFVCPESGRYTVLGASYRDGQRYRCEVDLVRNL